MKFATRRRIVQIFDRSRFAYDAALTRFFEERLRFFPRRHGFWWAVAIFNFNPCPVCFFWRGWGWGTASGLLAALAARLLLA